MGSGDTFVCVCVLQPLERHVPFTVVAFLSTATRCVSLWFMHQFFFLKQNPIELLLLVKSRIVYGRGVMTLVLSK